MPTHLKINHRNAAQSEIKKMYLCGTILLAFATQTSAKTNTDPVEPTETLTETPTETGTLTPAEVESIESPDDIMSDLDLMGSVDLLFEDFDIVISASRSEQTSNLASAPVSILSASDIHYSGVSELPQLLGYLPGVDALQLDRNRWAIGVRGLHQIYSDRTLFLINGRNASNPVHGGFDLQVLPIFLEDIRQVEAVRGPGGAVWGPNAFNGVINIIEKDPRDTTGIMLSERISEQGDFKTNFRVGAASEKFAWRLSGEFNDVSSSDGLYTITPGGTAVAPAGPKDFLHSERFKFTGVYDFSDDTSLDFGIGASHVERGDSPFLAFQVGSDERLDLLTAHAKLTKEFSPDASGYIQWYGTYQDVNRPSTWRYNAMDQSIDGQYNFQASNDHQITLGGTARFVHLNISQPRTTDALPAGASAEQWAGFFVGDRWEINNNWILESQLRADWYSETTLDWSGRVALLRTFGEQSEHVLRFAFAKAFRNPQTGLRDLSSERIPIGGGLFGINLIPAGEIDNEELYSFEIGYSGKIRDGLTFRADAYLQYYQDLTGAILLPEPAPVVGRSFFTIDNIGAAKAYGLETELKYQHEKATFSIWYAYNDFEYDLTNQNARAFRPARNKVGSTIRYQLNDTITLNANYRYTDTTPADFTSPVRASNRFDLSATILLEDLHAELQFGVLDLFDDTDLLIFDQSATSIASETPGRSFFVQLHMNF